jgi:hypothetical protein
MVEGQAAREFIERIFATESSDSEGAVLALQQAHGAVAGELSRVIGTAGFNAMFVKSIARAKLSEPVLDGLPLIVGDEFLGALWARLRGEEPAVIRSVGIELITCLFDTLATFIGPTLALQLFQNAWPDDLRAPPDAPAVTPAGPLEKQ